MRTVIALELRQRVRSVSWYVLLALWFILIGGLTFGVLGFVSQPGSGVDPQDVSAGLFSIIVYFTLGLALVVVPGVGGGSINSDRQSGVLGLVQVTPLSTASIVWGKFFAAWIASLAYLVVATPFLAWTAWIARTPWQVIVVSVLVLVLETGFVSALAVAISGLIAHPVFSIVITYLVVALLTVGTVVAFGLAGANTTTTVNATEARFEPAPASPSPSGSPSPSPQPDTGQQDSDQQAQTCTNVPASHTVQRFDRYWSILAANPFVVLADATPAAIDAQGNAVDGFGALKAELHRLQVPPEGVSGSAYPSADPCGELNQPVPENGQSPDNTSTAQWALAQGQPYWLWGLGGQLAAAVLLLGWAVLAVRVPRRSVPRGTRL